jgi:hypothetical protein
VGSSVNLGFTHDLVIKTGEYNDCETGETSIKLDCLPVGLPDWNGWVSVFPRDRTGRGIGGQPQDHGQTRPPGRTPQQGEHSGYSNPGQGQPNWGQGQALPPQQTFDDDIPF